MDERLRILNEKLNMARHSNNIAASNEIARIHQLHDKTTETVDTFEIPMAKLDREEVIRGATSEDHANDVDVAQYLREIRNVKPQVYEQYQERYRYCTRPW